MNHSSLFSIRFSRAAVEQHPTLTGLDFSRDPRRAHHGGGMSADDVELLMQVLPNTNVESINLAFNRIGDEGASTIAGALRKTKLKSLDLETAGINAAGTAAVAAVLAKDDSDVHSINFSHNNIGGAVDSLIEAAKKHSKLKHVGDEGTVVGGSRLLSPPRQLKFYCPC